MKYIYLIVCAFIFISCSSKEVQIVPVNEKKEIIEDVKKSQEPIEKLQEPIEICDLVDIPQDVSFFTKELNNSVDIYSIQKKYEKYYFNVWNDSTPRESLDDIKWPYEYFKYGNSYGENLQLLEQSFFEEMLKKANFDSYGSINKKAISLKDLNIRAFPTNKPLLRDPAKAGEGFPFDYLQNSTVHANKPLFLSHYSQDRAWAYIFSSFASGWVKTSDIVTLEEKHVELWKKAQQVIFTKENIPLHSKGGTFLFYSKIGIMLPLISQSIDSYTVLAVSTYKNSEPVFESVVISKDIAQKDTLNLGRDDLKNIMGEVMKSNYGWGGSYEQRDCSSTLRDLYAPFGIWLPRNSSQQAKVGKVISFKNLSDDEKIAIIKEKGIPFQTLLYKKGHIVLYVGLLDDEIIIFHNTWGIKTEKDGVEGREVIGKTIFSTLKLGRGLQYYDEESEILKNLKSMNIITQ